MGGASGCCHFTWGRNLRNAQERASGWSSRGVLAPGPDASSLWAVAGWLLPIVCVRRRRSASARSCPKQQRPPPPPRYLPARPFRERSHRATPEAWPVQKRVPDAPSSPASVLSLSRRIPRPLCVTLSVPGPNPCASHVCRCCWLRSRRRRCGRWCLRCAPLESSLYAL